MLLMLARAGCMGTLIISAPVPHYLIMNMENMLIS